MHTSTFRLLSLLLLFCLAISLSAQVSSKADLAKQLLTAKLGELNLTPNDLLTMGISSETYSENSGVTNIYFQQYINDIPVHGAILNAHVTANNELLTYGNRFVSLNNEEVKGALPAGIPVLSSVQALRAALVALGISETSALVQVSADSGPIRETVFDKGTIALENIKVQLVYQPIGDNGTMARLAWQVEIQTTDSQNWWLARVDAETGELLDKNNYVLHCNFGVADAVKCDHKHGAFAPHQHTDSNVDFAAPFEVSPPLAPPVLNRYKVYPQPIESPNHISPFPPTDSRIEVLNPASLTASPFGWHDTNGVTGAEYTITRGNNAHAYTDTNADNSPDAGSSPDGGVDLDFVFPLDLTQAPSAYRPAAVTNLFYWSNYIHDFAYAYGFTPANGNFQVNNYGGGGAGNDDVQAEAQDGSGTNNANFSTPPDGQRPRMQMFIGSNPNPDVDGDFDNGVVAHEYGHGISNRFTGGPNNTSCLGNTEQMGEGWSDFYALMTTMEPGDLGVDSRGIGTYLFGQPANGAGIRPTPYSTDMAINTATYNTIKTASIPHGIGYVWCGMVWDLAWAMINDHGQTLGYDVAMNLVNEGMRLQPCSPGFVDGRDAILAADVALYGGENRCRIWEVFARRGLGFSATQGSTNNRSDGVEAFDLPPTCFMDAEPEIITVCAPTGAVYIITAGEISASPINLSVTGLPAGATSNFTPNPLPAAGGISTLTILDTDLALPGSYTLTVSAVSGATTINDDVVLNIQNTAPSAPNLVSPSNMAMNQYNPQLSWSTSSNANTYEVQVSTVPTFASTVVDVTGLAVNNYQITATLSSNTTHYWRTRGVNTCGTGEWSSVFSFKTYNAECLLNPTSTNVPVTISSSGTPTVTSTLNVTGVSGDIIFFRVKNLLIHHSWMGDVKATLIAPDNTNYVLFDRPGTTGSGDGCSQNHILATFDDAAVLTAAQLESACNSAGGATPPPYAINGTYKPVTLLAPLNGTSPNGTWTLQVQDFVNQDGGSIQSWGLEFLTNCEANLELTQTFIEGYMEGTTMRPVLMNSGVPNATATQCDTITIALHSPTAPFEKLYSTQTILSTTGIASAVFPTAVVGDAYYIVVKGRNIIETWSAIPIVFSANSSYDFGSFSQAYGDNLGTYMTPSLTRVPVIYSGNFSTSTVNSFVGLEEYIEWETGFNNLTEGYINTDIDGNGFTGLGDYILWEANFNNLVEAIKP